MPDRQTEAATVPAVGTEKTIYSCNFRSAGRLSNENARSLTAILETYARHLSNALDAFLGTGIEVKMCGLDQMLVKDHIVGIQPLTYILPFSSTSVPSALIVECDLSLAFPMVELLLGGPGNASGTSRDLSEIEEEIMQGIVLLIVRQAENIWRMPDVSLTPTRRIKSSVLHQFCPPNEKVTVARFEFDVAGTTGAFQLVFPMEFLNLLLQQIKFDSPQKRGSVRFFPRPDIRERILTCDIEMAAELQGLRVPVKDLIALQPGSVLKLHAPIRVPGKLTAAGQVIFEATPVRSGSKKAAQLGRRIPFTNWEKA